MIPPLRIAALCIGLLIASPASALIYTADDGTSEQALGHGASGDFLWGNYFIAISGSRVISQIEIAFGSTNVPVGRAYTALLYDDLDDDGDPTGGLSLVASLTGTVQNPQGFGANTFEVADIADTLVTGGFFVAVFMDGTGNPFPSLFDQTSNSGQSWFAENDTNGALDVNDPFGTSTLNGEPSTYGFPGNFMVRAIPEPGSAALLAVALLLLPGAPARSRNRAGR